MSNKDIKRMEELSFPKFEDIPVSTKTIVVKLNIKIDLDKMVSSLPFTKYIIVPKKRGRKKKITPPDPNRNIPCGSIITLQFGDKLRGVDLKQKKKDTNKIEVACANKKRGFFRNAATIVMIIDGKIINFKVCHNGKFQMTGCKKYEHAIMVLNYMWSYMKDFTDVYKFNDANNTDFEGIIVPAMRNIDFSLGFFVNREQLDSYINENTKYTSLLETSFGYTGVNIKFPMLEDITKLKLDKLVYNKEKDCWNNSVVTYMDYLDTLPEKEKEKKLTKERNNTFLVFHSGKVILSGICAKYQEDAYLKFLDIIRDCKYMITEKINADSTTNETFEYYNNVEKEISNIDNIKNLIDYISPLQKELLTLENISKGIFLT